VRRPRRSQIWEIDVFTNKINVAQCTERIMWRKLSLRRRLNLMFAGLLLLWLAAEITRILASAGPRVQAEERSMSRITQEFVQSSLAGMQQSTDPESDLSDLVKSLQFLRHVRVGLGQGAVPAILGADAEPQDEAPAWFRALVRTPAQVALIPAVINGRNFGAIAIVADPAEEVDEVWSQARAEVAGVSMLAVVALVATSLFLRRSLRPLDVAGATLARLEAGDYQARAETAGAPEFVALCTRINRLGEALGQLNADNRRLIERVLDAQEEERKNIARELHDEIGPHLFAIRASAAALASRLDGGRDAPALEAARTIGAETEALQQQNRRILADLRPASLEELGLAAALQSLIERLRRTAPDIEVALEVGEEAETLGAKAALTVYRVVQEALTNAFRHSGARRVAVHLSGEADAADGDEDHGSPGLVLRIRDDGRGLPARPGDGVGLIGMRERVKALGGTFAIRPNAGGGTMIEARFGA
jgi:two-component system, NarL family, sensor histidine kinase UhpB